ncbi:sensor histidine kinase [Epilithonimonas mollis]|uniref:histidine kinase n=1 Tax=Epilithonimonas mollis TaxID=216903 RepID=A0A1M6NBV4_9FLAO|nr:histidine kinase [Epilithonimonas mollis]SHJ93154.1 two-component system, NarL family, sensor histidine kinase DesK [Epilithonimonas mollis]
MKFIPDEIKLTYLISIFVMMFFVGFLIFLVFIYNKRQLFFHQQQKLRESEHQNLLLQKELEKQKEIENERVRISSDMHDDIGARISALKLQGEFIKENYTHDAALQSELEELLNTTSEMTVAMREMIWSLKTENDFLLNFIDFTHKYASDFFSRSKMKLHFNNNIKDNIPLYSEVRRNLLFCYKETLNNIYKHSQASDVSILFSIDAGQLKLEIYDNGIGMPANSEQISSGNGIYNMQNRMNNIAGRLDIPQIDNGCKLVFTLPFSK